MTTNSLFMLLSFHVLYRIWDLRTSIAMRLHIAFWGLYRFVSFVRFGL